MIMHGQRMTLSIPDLRVEPDVRAVQYDGTNGTYVASCIASAEVSSDDGTTLTLSLFGGLTLLPITSGQWVVVLGGSLQNIVADEVFSAEGLGYRQAMSAQDIENAIAAIEPVMAAGIESIPSLIAGAQTNVNVTLVPAMSGTAYSAAPVLVGGAQLLGSLSVLSHTVVDEDTVTVTVKNNGLVTLAGAQVLVTAVA